MTRKRRFAAVAAAIALVALAAFVAITKASPAAGVTATPLARGTYPAYDLKTDPKSPIDFKAKTKESTDVVSAGQGYVDTGMGHIGFNETSAPAQDVTVAIAPVGAPFRTELDAPGPYCNF